MEGRPGTIIVGSNEFTVQLAQSLKKAKAPALIVDSSWEQLRFARLAGVDFYHGEMLSEQTEFNLDTSPYDYLIGATDYYSYNSLVCTTFIPEYGRNNVFKVSPYEEEINGGANNMVDKVGGRTLFAEGLDLEVLNRNVRDGYIFRQTAITSRYSYDQYLADKEEDTVLLYLIQPSGQIKFYSEQMRTIPGPGDTIVSLTPPVKELTKIQKKLETQRNRQDNNS